MLATLTAHEWPGNVRELENEMRRLVVMAGEAVTLEMLSPGLLERSRGGAAGAEEQRLLLDAGGDLRAAVADFERRAIQAALTRHEGNKSRAASSLGISRFALQRKLDKYGLASNGEPEAGPDGAEAAPGE